MADEAKRKIDELNRLIVEQREHIEKLKIELAEEINKSKNAKHDKIREIKGVRDEEQEKSRAEQEELQQKLLRQHQEKMIGKMEDVHNQHKTEIERLQRSYQAELQAQAKELENEKKEAEEKTKSEVTERLTDQLGSTHDSKIQKLTMSLFKVEQKVTELEDRNKDLVADNAELKNTIKSQDKEHEKSIASLTRQSKMESQKQIGELKERERELQDKEKELAAMSRKCAEEKAAKEKLEYKMELQRKSASINVPPTSLTPKRDTASHSTELSLLDTSPPHTKISHNELLLKNSELGYLVHRLQKEMDSLTKDKAKLQESVDIMEKEIGPLRDRHRENMMKIQNMHANLNIKQKELNKASEEKLQAVAEKVEIEKKLANEKLRIKTKDRRNTELQKVIDEKEKEVTALNEHCKTRTEIAPIPEHDKVKSKDSKTTELQRTRRLLQDKERELATLKVEVEEMQRKRKMKATFLSAAAPLPTPPPTSPSLSSPMKASDNLLAGHRAVEHKRKVELEQKVEELMIQLQEKSQSKHKLWQRVEDLNASLKRRDKQLKTLTDSNHRLKSDNQMLEESRERKKREIHNDWTSSHNDLERAHAQINKLQQQKSTLKEKVIQLERQTPSPEAGQRATSPQRRIVSPRPWSSSPIPLSPSHGSPLSQLHVSYEEEDFGSQWSLASNDSILKEQLEQMEYDKDEVSIKYDELKKEFGQSKGKYNTLQERYRSLLGRCRSMQNKLQEREKERLQLEKEMTLLQEECQNEFDVKREAHLRENLHQKTLRITELEAVLEEQFDKSGEDEEQLKIERERNTDLTESVQQLTQQMDEQREVTEKRSNSNELEADLERARGQLEGEKAVVASIKQQLQNLRDENSMFTSSPPAASPYKAPPTVTPKLQDCLQSAGDIVQEMKRVTKAESSPDISHDYLVQQLEGKLSEVKGLLKGCTPLTPNMGEDGFEDTDAPPSSASFNKNEKFEEWLVQFQKEKSSLKSEIGQLEERLSEGSHHVLELQGLVKELENRLSSEQNHHVSLIAERDGHITSLSSKLQLSQKQSNNVMLTLEDTNRAVERRNMNAIQIEMSKLDEAVRELLSMVHPYQSFTQMTSSVVPTSPPQSTDVSFSLSPSLSPIKSLSPACSYPTITPVHSEPLLTTIQSVGRTNMSHLYVALFDYDPKSFCSTGHPEKELELHTGDVLSVVGDMNSSGYYTAEFDGRRGLIPAAFIQEMHIDDKDTEYRLLNQSMTHSNVPSRMGSEVELSLRKPTPLSAAKPAPPTCLQVDQIIEKDSLLVTWTPPSLDNCGNSNECIVTGYSLLCDGEEKMDVIGALASHTILQDIDVTKSHTLAIVTVAKDGPPSYLNSFSYIGISVQYIRALYNYDPDKESPNPNPNLELRFEKGDLLIVYGEMRKDRFYQGQLNGKQGLIPSNFIEIEDTPTTVRNQSHSIGAVVSTYSSEVKHNEIESLSNSELLTTKCMRALHNYNPKIDSINPNATLELEFKKDDILIVHGEMRKDKFYHAELNGKFGIVPSNCIVEIEHKATPTEYVATPPRQPPIVAMTT